MNFKLYLENNDLKDNKSLFLNKTKDLLDYYLKNHEDIKIGLYKKALVDYDEMDDDKFFHTYNFNRHDGSCVRSPIRLFKFGQTLLKLQEKLKINKNY